MVIWLTGKFRWLLSRNVYAPLKKKSIQNAFNPSESYFIVIFLKHNFIQGNNLHISHMVRLRNKSIVLKMDADSGFQTTPWLHLLFDAVSSFHTVIFEKRILILTRVLLYCTLQLKPSKFLTECCLSSKEKQLKENATFVSKKFAWIMEVG